MYNVIRAIDCKGNLSVICFRCKWDPQRCVFQGQRVRNAVGVLADLHAMKASLSSREKFVTCLALLNTTTTAPGGKVGGGGTTI